MSIDFNWPSIGHKKLPCDNFQNVHFDDFHNSFVIVQSSCLVFIDCTKQTAHACNLPRPLRLSSTTAYHEDTLVYSSHVKRSVKIDIPNKSQDRQVCVLFCVHLARFIWYDVQCRFIMKVRPSVFSFDHIFSLWPIHVPDADTTIMALDDTRFTHVLSPDYLFWSRPSAHVAYGEGLILSPAHKTVYNCILSAVHVYDDEFCLLRTLGGDNKDHHESLKIDWPDSYRHTPFQHMILDHETKHRLFLVRPHCVMELVSVVCENRDRSTWKRCFIVKRLCILPCSVRFFACVSTNRFIALTENHMIFLFTCICSDSLCVCAYIQSHWRLPS
jgi:hypothetical protein